MGNISTALRAVGRTVQRSWNSFCNWVSQPHIQRRILLATVVGAGVAVLIPLGIATLGFGPTGVVAGSIAAGWQAIGGIIAAESLFATFQSLGMTAGALNLGVGMGALTALGVAVIDSP